MNLRKKADTLLGMRCCIRVLYSSFHLNITLYVLSRSVVSKLNSRVLRTSTLFTIRQRTSSMFLRGSILACFTLAVNFCRQCHNVTYTNLCELREVLVTGRAQGKPRPTLLILQRQKKKIFSDHMFVFSNRTKRYLFQFQNLLILRRGDGWCGGRGRRSWSRNSLGLGRHRCWRSRRWRRLRL